MVVDHQWHWMAPEQLQLLETRTVPPRALSVDGTVFLEFAEGLRFPIPPTHVADLSEHMQTAAASGIDAVLNSPTLFGEVLHLEATEAAELLTFNAEIQARAQREFPGRFFGLAMLPMQDVEAALAVLDGAATLGLRGVSMLCSIDGRPIATPVTEPIFARIAELRLPVVLHPAIRSSTWQENRTLVAEVGLGWMYHTALAAVNLMESGVLDAHPDLTVLHPHLGGMLPYVLGRVERALGGKRSASDYTHHNFFTDTPNYSRSPAALELAVETYGIDRVLFATDYPFGPIDRNFELVRDNASKQEAEMIFANVLPGLGTTA